MENALPGEGKGRGAFFSLFKRNFSPLNLSHLNFRGKGQLEERGEMIRDVVICKQTFAQRVKMNEEEEERQTLCL